MLPCVSTTPLGSLVEPDENWMKATSSGRQLRRRAFAGDVVEVVDQECAGAQRVEGSPPAGPVGKLSDAIERLAVGVDEGRAQLARDAQQLVPVFVADADGHRHRHDAA